MTGTSFMVLGIDFETQCADASTTKITEVGAILTDFLFPDPFATVITFNSLCWDKSYPPQTAFIEDLTQITTDTLKSHGRPREEVWQDLLPLVKEADLIVAYNKSFDQTVFESECIRQNIGVPNKTWICAMTEVPYPDKYTCKKLSHLVWEHDIPVERSKLHRASYDALIMLKLLHKYNISEVIAYAGEPWVYLEAIVKKPWLDHGVSNQKAKKLSYGWEKAKGDDKQVFQGQWVKRVKMRELEKEFKKGDEIGLKIIAIN